jgi:hypothetical protein
MTREPHWQICSGLTLIADAHLPMRLSGVVSALRDSPRASLRLTRTRKGASGRTCSRFDMRPGRVCRSMRFAPGPDVNVRSRRKPSAAEKPHTICGFGAPNVAHYTRNKNKSQSRGGLRVRISKQFNFNLGAKAEVAVGCAAGSRVAILVFFLPRFEAPQLGRMRENLNSPQRRR